MIQVETFKNHHQQLIYNAEVIASRFLKFEKASERANTAPPTDEQI